MLVENRLFNDGWQFKKISFTGEESSWKSVDLPHDWHIYNAKELYEDGEGWYKKSFEYYAHHRRTFIRFDGVYMDTTVWVNEHMVGVWKYGYSTFEYEITAFLKEGANDIKVRTIFKNPNSRWYSGAGIYRNVWIRSKPTTCLVSDGTYISSTVEGNVAKVIVSTEVDFSVTSNKGDYNIFYEILTDEGLPVASAEKSVLEEGTTLLNIDSPVCWDIDNPYRYTMRVNLREGERVVEKEDIRFGVRTIAYDSEHGFYLNGRHVKFYGVCMHHDLGCPIQH